MRHSRHLRSIGALMAATILFSPLLIAQERVSNGLQVFYDFQETEGALVKDRSGAGVPVHLQIADPSAVRRLRGALQIIRPTVIRSKNSVRRLNVSIKRTGAVTVEAWIRPFKLDQKGPARIVSLSKNSTNRNLTLGQEADRYDVRLRTTKTSDNGIPSYSSDKQSVTTNPTHVVYTRNRSGRATYYLNGVKDTSKKFEGTLSNWQEDFPLNLANEASKDRPWLGTMNLVAIYNRELTSHEVLQNFQAGPRAQAAPIAQADPKETHFEMKIAPILANHCLECHDASNRKGKLDLSNKAAAFAGGRDGPPIVPGKHAESLLWELVESDDMPEDRTPLNDEEKALLKEWIDSGATWSLDTIDPAVYAHGPGEASHFVQRLTLPEYVETVRSATGVDIREEAKALLPPDLRADGFSNTAYNLNVDLKHVESYAKLAEKIVSQMDVMAFAKRHYDKTLKFTDKDMGKLISAMGQWLLRGPVEDHELIAYRGISTTVASAGGKMEEAIALIIEAMLQSPRFIYRVERQQGDGTPWPIGPEELACRMSYIIWGAPPDEALFKAAAEGELYDPQLIAKQVDRMLADSRAEARSKQFVSEWLNLNRLNNMNPNKEHFPNWDPKLANDMRDETLAFFEEVIWQQQRPLADLLNAQFTYLTPALAKHYGLPAVGDQTLRYDLSAVPHRGGLLTQGSVLTIGGDEASMVTRGLFVMHDLLRGVVKDPPPGTDTTPVPSKPGLTQRDVAERRVADRTCGGCHARFEPLAFGLERFDGLGSFHEKDHHGNQLREDGEILLPGTAEPVQYTSSAQLMNLLAESPRVQESLTWKLTQFALGRPLGAADAKIVTEIHQEAAKQGGTYQATLKAIILSDLVQMTRTEAL